MKQKAVDFAFNNGIGFQGLENFSTICNETERRYSLLLCIVRQARVRMDLMLMGGTETMLTKIKDTKPIV